MPLHHRYFERLDLLERQEELAIPSKENLAILVEAHLSKITFDNLSQHGLPLKATLDTEATAHKILDQQRGGFCFEVNGLLAEWLEELGYSVQRVPAIVHAGPEIGFRDLATHVVLIVTIASDNDGHDGNDDDDDDAWFVDVGFGEPAIVPLKYELDLEQKTPEGMTSRIVRLDNDEDFVVLEWKQADNTWSPRLKWQWGHPGQALQSTGFQEALDHTLGDTSIFHEKLIVCKLTRDEKLTLAGTRLKRTTPRFGSDSKVTVLELESEANVKRALEDTFGVPDASSLDLTQSNAADPKTWTQL